MKKLITALFCGMMGTVAFGQWTPTTPKLDAKNKASDLKAGTLKVYYKLDLEQIKSQLKNAQESGPNARPVYISLPSLNGKIEKFAVYSFPVMDKELADQYQLGSYTGVSLDDPTKFVRFSVAPNDFQSMISKAGEYEFIEATDSSKTIYAVHPKTNKSTGQAFTCSTSENPMSVAELEKLKIPGQSFTNQGSNFAKSSDKKYRTMRLAMSVTGEYTQFFGGVAGALAQINATMTRVNGVFEKDFALHLNVLNFPTLIYDNPVTDGYATVTDANNFPASWNLTLQQKLTATVGNAGYDIGHLFGASGGGGSAGCIGCVCINPTTANPYGKGSGITSPATGSVNPTTANPPSGDTFDIDYVAHEMGHQLGANHTYSHVIEGSYVNMEPGSGSTIMGYAGITNANVQMNSDPYFHVASILQVEDNLIDKTCDVEISINNNPPAIAPLTTYSIPKGTAFVLTASATDQENDPMTYTWEEFDDAAGVITGNQFTGSPITASNLGNTIYGASFRSVLPTTSPTRYFPKLSSVLNGVLNSGSTGWEAVSTVARTSNFVVTVRDNHPIASQQQTQSDIQTINVGNDGPFKVNTQYANGGFASPIEWAVANTAAAPYNVTNVKIDYTTNDGVSWTVLAASTPNDGAENLIFPASLNGQIVKLRISSINNVFYAIGPVNVAAFTPCDGTAPTGVVATNITVNGATINLTPVLNATYILRYRKAGTTIWTEVTSTTPTITLAGLNDLTSYEVQVASVCSGTTGSYSATVNFTTLAISYCTASSVTSANLFISNVTVANLNNTSTGSIYSNFTTNPALQVNLVKGVPNTMTITANLAAANLAMVFIDYNKDGIFSANERVLNFPVTNASLFTGTFTVPATALEGQVLRMRVFFGFAGPDNLGLSGPASWACGVNVNDGEVEDYNVVVASTLSTNETSIANSGIQIYPNPATDFLNVTKVSDKATYKIYSAAGQLVGNGNISNGKINVSSLIKGAYVISIEDKGKESFNSKFIKK
ncbi:reprolysin-like metallopeptidase [Chryseobacterium indoltheticum]|uniref:reprolysin-like metallopeptidase n=1 Tax=Chryseobacterium indoltheticum TaxID=254 RepID=UPI00404252F2